MTKEQQIEDSFIKKLEDLKYTYRQDIHDKVSLEQNFRTKFEALNRFTLHDAEFHRLRDEIVTADVFTAAKTLREQHHFETPAVPLTEKQNGPTLRGWYTVID